MTVKKAKTAIILVSIPTVLSLAIALLIGSYQLSFKNKIYFGVIIAGVEVGGLDKEEAIYKLTQSIRKNEQLLLRSDLATFYLPNSLLKVDYDLQKTVDLALAVGKSGKWWENLESQYYCLFKNCEQELVYSLDDQYLENKLSQIALVIDKPVIQPQIKIEGSKASVSKGEQGNKLNKERVRRAIKNTIAFAKNGDVELTTEKIGLILTDKQQEQAQQQAQSLITKELTLKLNEQLWKLTNDQVFDLLTVGSNLDLWTLRIGDENGFFEVREILFGKENEIRESEANIGLQTDQDKIAKLALEIAGEIDRPSKNALFQFEQGKVVVFQPAVDGRKLDQQKLINTINQIITQTENKTLEVELPVAISPAKIKTGEVNNLGINELIGQGKSTFTGSSSERVHNIKLATSKVNGTLLAPGDTFSFNGTVGDISLATGYTTAYIISKGRTVLGEGGGVCQVSTTVFRAALFSGLPFEERHAHAYRVSYYEKGGSKVGLDATIYSPKIDLKFKNDTTGHILIQGYVQGTSLFFDFYGTKDERLVSVSNPVVTNVVPAPQTIYEDDPSLPEGTTKQVDFAAAGANVLVNRTVTKNGEVLKDEFVSRYKPWQAVYKVGTKEG